MDDLDTLKPAQEMLRSTLPEVPAFSIHLGGHFAVMAETLLDDEDAHLRVPLHTLVPALGEEPNADGFVPQFIYGKCRNVPVLLFAGERRISEGKGSWPVLFPTALTALYGIRNHIFVDAGMSLHPDLKAGNWAMLTDFINGYGFSPTDGMQKLAACPYPDLSQVFSQHLNSELLNALAKFGPSPMLSTYIGVPGFHIPTQAEASHYQATGADVMGHDLVLHLMAAAVFGCQVSAMVLATAQLLPARPAQPLTRKDVQATVEFCTPQLLAGLKTAVQDIHAAQVGGLPENTLPEADADHVIHQNIRRAASGRVSPLRAFLHRTDSHNGR